MPTLDDIRAQYPQYGDMPDADLAGALYSKFYSDIPRADFDAKIGLKPAAPAPKQAELRAYNPSMRDKVATFLTDLISGGERPSEGVARGVEIATGSRGLGVTGPGIVDATPIGPLFAGDEALRASKEGDIVGAGISALGAIPAVGPPVRAAATAAKPGMEAAAAAARQGMTIPGYMASDNLVQKRVAGGLSGTPVIGDPIARATRATAESAGSRVAEIADAVAPSGASPQAAGGIARDQLAEWITGKGSGSSANLMKAGYDALDQRIKPDTFVPLNRTRLAAGEMKADDIASATPDGQKIISMVQDALQRPQGLTYEGLKTLRTRIGDKLDQSLEPGVSGKLLNRIYGSLSEDLRFAAQRAGVAKRGSSGAAALQAFDDATARAREIFGQRAELARIVGAQGDATGAQVFERIMSLAGSTSRGDVARLQLAKRAMGTQAWDEVTAARIRSMGLDKNDMFSPARFNTEYGSKRFPEDAKRVLFDRDTKAALDDIYQVSRRWEENQAFGNPSGSGRSIAVTGALVSAWVHPLSLIAEAIGGYALSSALARPASAQAIARYVNASAQYAQRPSPATQSIVRQTIRTLAPTVATLAGGDSKTLEQQLEPKAQKQAARPVSSFEEALKLPKGARFVDPNGVERVR